MQNRNRIRCSCFVLLTALGFVQQTWAHPVSNDVWKDYGFNCLISQFPDISGFPIATLRVELGYKSGPTHFAKDNKYAYLLWGNVEALNENFYLYREALSSIDNCDQKTQNKLEKFSLTKAAATCDKVDLIYFKVPLDEYPNIVATEKMALRIQGSLELWKLEDGKGEFGDPAFISYGLRANMVEMTRDGNAEIGTALFERIAKIKKRFDLNLLGASALDVKIIGHLTQDVCDHQKEIGWINNLPPIECINESKVPSTQ